MCLISFADKRHFLLYDRGLWLGIWLGLSGLLGLLGDFLLLTVSRLVCCVLILLPHDFAKLFVDHLVPTAIDFVRYVLVLAHEVQDIVYPPPFFRFAVLAWMVSEAAGTKFLNPSIVDPYPLSPHWTKLGDW